MNAKREAINNQLLTPEIPMMNLEEVLYGENIPSVLTEFYPTLSQAQLRLRKAIAMIASAITAGERVTEQGEILVSFIEEQDFTQHVANCITDIKCFDFSIEHFIETRQSWWAEMHLLKEGLVYLTFYGENERVLCEQIKRALTTGWWNQQVCSEALRIWETHCQYGSRFKICVLESIAVSSLTSVVFGFARQQRAEEAKKRQIWRKRKQSYCVGVPPSWEFQHNDRKNIS